MHEINYLDKELEAVENEWYNALFINVTGVPKNRFFKKGDKMSRVLNLVANTSLAVVICTALVGCADALQNFKCHRSDFAMVQDQMDRLNVNEQSPAVLYETARDWNTKLAETCPVEVLQKCTGKTEAHLVGSHGEIDGPINAFGFHGRTSLEAFRVHDEFTWVTDYKLNYYAQVDMKAFETTLACFRNNTN